MSNFRLTPEEYEKAYFVLTKKLEGKDKEIELLNDKVHKLEMGIKKLKDNAMKKLKRKQDEIKSIMKEDKFEDFEDVDSKEVLYHQAIMMMRDKAISDKASYGWQKICNDFYQIVEKGLKNGKRIENVLTPAQRRVVDDWLERTKIKIY